MGQTVEQERADYIANQSNQNGKLNISNKKAPTIRIVGAVFIYG